MSNNSEMKEATQYVRKVDKAMKRRGVHQATDMQVRAWIAADEKEERNEILRFERAGLPFHKRIIHFIKHLF